MMAENPHGEEDFAETLRQEGISKETVDCLVQNGCENWKIFSSLTKSDIDDLDILKLQKPLLKKLLPQCQEKDGASSSQSGSSEKDGQSKVNLDIENVVDSDICGVDCPKDAKPPKFGSMNIHVRNARGSTVTGYRQTATESHRSEYSFGAGWRQSSQPQDPGRKRVRLEQAGKGRGDAEENRGMPELPVMESEREAAPCSSGDPPFMSSASFARHPNKAQDVAYIKRILFEERAADAVGVIRTRYFAGTCFLVGSCYVVTCWHIVERAFNESGVTNMKIEFYHLTESHSREEKVYCGVSSLVYKEPSFDVAIMEIYVDGQPGLAKLPKPLSLTKRDETRMDVSEMKTDPVHLIGHPDLDTLKIDFNIEFVQWNSTQPEQERIEKFHRKLKEKADKEICEAYKNGTRMNFHPPEVSFESANLPQFVTFHTAFCQGASGAPGVFVDLDGKVKARVMLVSGLPAFYFELKDEWRAKHMPDDPKLRLEQGLDFVKLYEHMTKYESNQDVLKVMEESFA